MSAQAQTAGAGSTRLPPPFAQERPSAKYLLFGSWVLATEGALTLVLLPVLVFSTSTTIPPANIALFGLVGVVCLVGAGLIYVRRAWTWWVALGAAVGSAGYLLAVGGLTSAREADAAAVLSAAVVVLLILGKSSAGDADALALASARIPFRLKVTLVWVAVFFMLGLFLALSDVDFGFIRENFWYIAGGLKFTILLAAAAIVLATILALFGALGRLSKNPVAVRRLRLLHVVLPRYALDRAALPDLPGVAATRHEPRARLGHEVPGPEHVRRRRDRSGPELRGVHDRDLPRGDPIREPRSGRGGGRPRDDVPATDAPRSCCPRRPA